MLKQTLVNVIFVGFFFSNLQTHFSFIFFIIAFDKNIDYIIHTDNKIAKLYTYYICTHNILNF